MQGQISSVLRWSRALLLALVVMVTGTVGHVTAAGLLPPAPVLAAALGVCTILCAAALGRPATRLRLVALTVLGQTGVHGMLSATAGHGEASPSASTSLASAPDAHHHLVADLATQAPMMGAHLVAAVLVGLWLASGERALWTVLALTIDYAQRLVVHPASCLHPCGPTSPHALAVDLPALRLVELAPCVVRRGPPVLLAA